MSIERTNRVIITANAAAHTKGNWSELIASTAADSKEIIVNITLGNAGTRSYLVDIGVGAGGAESVIIANLLFAPSPEGVPGVLIRLPIGIAAGSRLSARCQCSTGGATVEVLAYLVSGTSSAVVTTLGADTANTKGTTIDPGAVVSTKGSYVELTASVGVDVDYLGVIISGIRNAAPIFATFDMDVSTGAGGAEVVKIPDIFFLSLAPATPVGTWIEVAWSFELSIVSGTRIAVRAKSSTNDATDRLFDVILYAVSDVPSGGGEHSAVF